MYASRALAVKSSVVYGTENETTATMLMFSHLHCSPFSPPARSGERPKGDQTASAHRPKCFRSLCHAHIHPVRQGYSTLEGPSRIIHEQYTNSPASRVYHQPCHNRSQGPPHENRFLLVFQQTETTVPRSVPAHPF